MAWPSTVYILSRLGSETDVTVLLTYLQMFTNQDVALSVINLH
jgi:hypothetical protein